MNKVVNNLMIVSLLCFLTSGCAPKKTTTDSNTSTEITRDKDSKTRSATTSAKVGKIQNVNPQQFNKLLLLDEIQLLDVRTPEEFKSGHIKDAVNIDVNQSSFKSKVAQLDKNKPVLVYCRSGKRSDNAAEILKEMGFTKIVGLEGGMLSWEEAKLPINK